MTSSSTRLPLISLVVCILGGAIFAAGWWAIALGLFRNGQLAPTDDSRITLANLLPPLSSAIGVLLLTTVSRASIIQSHDYWMDQGALGAGRIMLFLWMAVALGGAGVSLALFLVYHQHLSVTQHALMMPIGSGLIALG